MRIVLCRLYRRFSQAVITSRRKSLGFSRRLSSWPSRPGMCLPSFIGCLVGSVSVTCCVGCLVVRPLGPGVGHLVSALFCRLRVCYVLSAIFLGQLSSFGSWPSRRRWCRPSCRLAPRLAPRMRCSQRSCRPSSRACCCFGRLSSGLFSRASSPATCGPSCRRRCPIFRRPSQRAWVSLLNTLLFIHHSHQGARQPPGVLSESG